ncbi:N1R/p28 gene family protein [Magpiepox virus]|nr:N1R/p28 gene family protein [Magpiepox virus]
MYITETIVNFTSNEVGEIHYDVILLPSLTFLVPIRIPLYYA